jgi:hypothetical protein
VEETFTAPRKLDQLRKNAVAIKIKSVDQAAAKFVSRASAAAPDYTNGVQNPRRDWAQSTSAADSTYAAGVQQAVSNGSFKKGVIAAGTDKWQRKSTTVGAQRFSSGVNAAKGDYATKVAPFFDVLSNLTLPPRQPKGDPSNVQRVAAVAQALRAKKLGL